MNDDENECKYRYIYNRNEKRGGRVGGVGHFSRKILLSRK